MAGSIHDPGWWQPYLPQLRREFAELTMDILIAGGDAGAGAMPAGSALVDWDVFNEDALTWLDMYLGGGAVPGLTQEGAYAWAWALNESTRRGVVKEIDRWVRSGAPLPELEKRLGGFFDQRRAHRVAVTEVTRIFASGNVMAWQASGVVSGKRWRTAVDERACPICSKLNGSFVELDRGWEFNQAALDADPALARALRAPLTVVVPPAHVGCRCWLQPVVFEALSDEERAAGAFRPAVPESGRPITVAPAAPEVLRPHGPAVSRALLGPKSGKTKAAIDRAMAAIDRVHGDGNLPEIPVKALQLREGVMGRYRYGGMERKAEIHIGTRTPAEHAPATMVHEVGHFLDHKGLPGSRFTSADPDYMEMFEEWHTAARDSRAIQRLIDQRWNPEKYEIPMPGGFSIRPQRGFLDYLVTTEEVWARSYAQYIATRSGDDLLRTAIAEERRDVMYGSSQWDDDDFEPIAKAIDRIFKALGWLR